MRQVTRIATVATLTEMHATLPEAQRVLDLGVVGSRVSGGIVDGGAEWEAGGRGSGAGGEGAAGV